MVISDAYWQRRFQRDPAIIGRELIVGGASLTVIGIAAPGFFGPFLAFRNPDVWIPLTMQDDIRYAFNASTDDDADNTKPWAPQPGIEWLSLFARVPDASNAAGVVVGADARCIIATPPRGSTRRTPTIAPQLRAGARRPLQRRPRRVVPARRSLVAPVRAAGDGRRAAGDHLRQRGQPAGRARERARARDCRTHRARRRTLARRPAAARGNDDAVVVGGALGLLVAAWGRDLLLSMFTGGAAIIDLDTSFDWRVLLFAVSVTMVCGLAAGILPALRSTRVAPTDAIKAQARQVGHAGGRRGAVVGKSLVAAQMAFCLLLLVVAGLFVRSMQALMQTDVGFDRDRLLVARMDVRSMGYSDDQRQALYDRVLERLRRIPGVESASVSLNGPLGTSRRASSLVVEGYTPAAERTSHDERRDRHRRLLRDRRARARRRPRLHARRCAARAAAARSSTSRWRGGSFLQAEPSASAGPRTMRFNQTRRSLSGSCRMPSIWTCAARRRT